VEPPCGIASRRRAAVTVATNPLEVIRGRSRVCLSFHRFVACRYQVRGELWVTLLGAEGGQDLVVPQVALEVPSPQHSNALLPGGSYLGIAHRVTINQTYEFDPIDQGRKALPKLQPIVFDVVRIASGHEARVRHLSTEDGGVRPRPSKEDRGGRRPSPHLAAGRKGPVRGRRVIRSSDLSPGLRHTVAPR